MAGIKLLEVIGIIRQIGFAVAGAGALWGTLFFAKSWGDEIARRLERLVLIAGAIGVLAWLAAGLVDPAIALAHEGIAVLPARDEFLAARTVTSPLVLGFVITLFMRRRLLFFAQFILASSIIGTTYWSGAFDARQLFHFLHGWHSIFTLGTVVVVDFLLFSPGWTSVVRKQLIEYFPVMSRAIWTGLAIDFASVALIFPEAFDATPKFFFAQTVVGIIILNGALLSGPITERLKTKVSSRWQAVALVSGVVSIVSWTTITALDAFKDLTLGYASLAGIYAAVIVAGIVALSILSRFSRHFAL